MQGFEAGTQISASSPGNLNFLVPTPEQCGPKANKKTLYCLYNFVVSQTMSMEPEPEFQAPALLSKIAWDPVPHLV